MHAFTGGGSAPGSSQRSPDPIAGLIREGKEGKGGEVRGAQGKEGE